VVNRQNVVRGDDVKVGPTVHSSHRNRGIRPRMEKPHSKHHELVDCPLFSIAR